MIYIDCRQGTQEWLDARSMRITASRVRDALDRLQKASGDKRAGDPSDKSDLYCAEIAGEIINGGPFGKPASGWALERGHEMEDLAIQAYEERFGKMVTKAGICQTEDGLFAYSSDGLIDKDGAVEVKSPVNILKIIEMWRSNDLSEYIHQCQTGLWITGRKWIDLIMYAPMFEKAKADLYVQRVYRDEEFIDEMVWRLHDFDKRIQALVEEIRSYGKFPSPIILKKKK